MVPQLEQYEDQHADDQRAHHADRDDRREPGEEALVSLTALQLTVARLGLWVLLEAVGAGHTLVKGTAHTARAEQVALFADGHCLVAGARGGR